MLAIRNNVKKFILHTKAQLKSQGHDYDKIIQNAEPRLITENEIEDFLNMIDKMSTNPNQRKRDSALKYFNNPEMIKMSNELDDSLMDFLRKRNSNFLTDGYLQLHMNTNLYEFKDIVCEWEQTCQKTQDRWWSNPVANLIAYQVKYLTGTLPFSYHFNDKHNNVPKPKRQNTSTKTLPEAKNDYGVIYLLTHKVNKKHYVGQTKRKLGKRLGEHSRYTSGCRLLRNAIKQDGFDSFDRGVLAICKISNLNRLEAFFINKYNCVYPNGYNISAGNLTFIDIDTEDESLMSYTKVDEMDVEFLIIQDCQAIRDAEDDLSRHDKLMRIKECHPDKTDDQEKNNECIELLKQLNQQ